MADIGISFSAYCITLVSCLWVSKESKNLCTGAYAFFSCINEMPVPMHFLVLEELYVGPNSTRAK